MLNEQSDLVKGFYSLFNNGKDDGLTYHKKKGSEIKQAVQNILIQINKEKNEYIDKMRTELDKIKFTPDSECSYNSDYKHLLDFIPKKFSYNLLYEGENYTRTDRGIEEQAINKPTDEERKEMQEYNEYAHRYMDACINKIKLEALRKNIQDSKSYNLSIDQLAILGL